MSDSGNFDVIGFDTDGTLLCRPEETIGDDDYNCGETLEQFGVENLDGDELEMVAESLARAERDGRDWAPEARRVLEAPCKSGN
jgi:hypothetical protein